MRTGDTAFHGDCPYSFLVFRHLAVANPLDLRRARTHTHATWIRERRKLGVFSASCCVALVPRQQVERLPVARPRLACAVASQLRREDIRPRKSKGERGGKIEMSPCHLSSRATQSRKSTEKGGQGRINVVRGEEGKGIGETQTREHHRMASRKGHERIKRLPR